MSSTSATQIKVTLPNELYLLIKSKAAKFGLNLAGYLRYLAINDAKEDDLPTFPMSAKQEKVLEKAMDDYKNGKTIRIDNIDDFLASLNK